MEESKVLTEELEGLGLPLAVFGFSSVDSTSSEARRRYEGGFCAPALFVAKEQTGGRGRRGREFSSPQGGLYLTVLWPVENALPELSFSTGKASVAVARAIDAVCGIRVGIKWVNDLYQGGKKVGGILVEALNRPEGGIGALLFGVGINLGKNALPPELASIAGCLDQSPKALVPLAGEICRQLLGEVADMKNSAFLTEYRQRSVVLGKRIRILSQEGEQEALAERIDEDGGLWVRLPDGKEQKLLGGEISLRPGRGASF